MDSHAALDLALYYLLENNLQDQALEVMEACHHHLRTRPLEDIKHILKARQVTAIVRVTQPLELPRSGPDAVFPNETHYPRDWSGVLFVLKPGSLRCYCTRDLGRYSQEECDQAFIRFGWYGGGLSLIDLYPEGIIDWETMETIPGVEIAYNSVPEMEKAHKNKRMDG